MLCGQYGVTRFCFPWLCVGKACTADGYLSRVVTCDTLAMFAQGTVRITTEPSFNEVQTGTLRHYIPPDYSFVVSLSSRAVESVRKIKLSYDLCYKLPLTVKCTDCYKGKTIIITLPSGVFPMWLLFIMCHLFVCWLYFYFSLVIWFKLVTENKITVHWHIT